MINEPSGSIHQYQQDLTQVGRWMLGRWGPACVGPQDLKMLEVLFLKVLDKVGLATELNYIHNQMCSFGLGYEFRLRQATFKGLISSDTTCSAVLEERVSAGVNLLLSGQLNHKKKDYKFGFGLAIGQG